MSGALFPGWRPDADGRERLSALVDALVSASPVGAPKPQPRRPEQWHATLCFMGDDLRHTVTPRLLAAFADAAARIPPHSFTLDRIEYWRQSGAVVALPDACPALQALCDETHAAVRRCGLRPQQATTQPHVTLAYLARDLEPQPWLADVDCTGAPLRVDGFELLFNAGGRYEQLAAWPLTGTTLPTAPHQPALL
ncbi:2'-5' RNA ligase family protein [Luteimonas kalidii]|uniref:2'-5' RNA ligase family protein n=1 Tax=Luteimonas kalidii TaxID=3042025 RepID=A0ABT6JTH8_9GAMM|nr:2'-5' RNA ligase family protein [Luteimonas kalidii]MDH5833996.1 2'-5' RNA ligase family protein [Luteimonas kalidii]